jgi:hypothetical protein
MKKDDEPKKLERESWMLDDAKDSSFSSLLSGGRSSSRHRNHNRTTQPAVSQRELNPDMRAQAGLPVPQADRDHRPDGSQSQEPSSWQIMKAQRVVEMAERENRPIDEVALQRFQSMDEFHTALSFVNNRQRSQNASSSASSLNRNPSHEPSRNRSSEFRRPGEKRGSASSDKSSAGRHKSRDHHHHHHHHHGHGHGHHSHSHSHSDRSELEKSRDSLIYATPDAASSQEELPIRDGKRKAEVDAEDTHLDSIPKTSRESHDAEKLETESKSLESYQSELNRLQAKITKARLKKDGKTESSLQKKADQLRAEMEALATKPSTSNVEALHSFDERGRYVDVGQASSSNSSSHGHARDRKKKHRGEPQHNHEDDMDVQTLLKLEKSSRGTMEDARRIMNDARYANDQEYLDANASKLAEGRPLTEAQKRHRAIHSQNAITKAMDKCPFCMDEVHYPHVPVIAVGTRVYLALPKTLPLVPHHCLIVPMYHHVSSLDCDDDEWDEIRNFMKCLLRMTHARNESIIFMETAIEFNRSWHTCIECIPVPTSVYNQAPGYFRQTILATSEEWSQNRKLIDSRKSGFRKSLVSNIPYFHVWFGLDGGYGHVIDEEERFPFWFGKEVTCILCFYGE